MKRRAWAVMVSAAAVVVTSCDGGSDGGLDHLLRTHLELYGT